MKFNFFIVILVTIIACSTSVFTQVSIESPQTTSVGPRFRSLGYNIVSVSGDVTGVLTNPASLTNIEYMQSSFGNQSHLGYFEFNTLQFAYPYKSVVFSFSYASNMLNNIPQTIERDNTIYPISNYNSGWNTYHFAMMDDYYITFFFDKFSYGIAAKILEQRLSTKRRSFGFDLGVMGSKFLNGFFGINEITMGLSFINIGNSKFNSWSPVANQSEGDESLTAMEYLSSMSFHVDKYDLVLHSGLSGFLDEDYQKIDKLSFGAEYNIITNFSLRGSIVRSIKESVNEFNLGLGLVLDKVSFANNYYMMRLDYNYTIPYFPFENDAKHSFGLSLLGQNRSVIPEIYASSKVVKTNINITQIEGKSEKSALIYLYKNDVKIREVKSDLRGRFIFQDIDLNFGKNRFFVKATNKNQSLSKPSKLKVIDFDNQPPTLEINYSVTKDKRFIVANLKSDESLRSIESSFGDDQLKYSKINDREYRLKFPFPEEYSSSTFVPEDQIEFSIKVRDRAGNESEIYKDKFVLNILGPKDRTLVSNHSFMINGSISKIISDLYIQDEKVSIDSLGNFSHTVASGYGKQLIKLTARTSSNVDLNYFIRVLTFKRFNDLRAGFPEKRHVELLATMGFIDGDSDGNFRPETVVTRRELIKQVVKTLKLKIPIRVKEDPFFDVPKSDKDAAYILTGVQEGIMFAFPDGNFKPDAELTVAEAFDILVNNDILDSDQLNVDKSPCTRLALAQMMKDINQYNERVEYLLNWDKGYTLK